MISILIADDIDVNIEVLQLAIEEYMDDNDIEEDNYEIKSVKNGEEAVFAVEKQFFDIIFLDIMMPKLDGLNALSRIREISLLKKPVIIMATALGDKFTKDSERERGANAYMVKPFGNKTVSLMLDYYLKKIENNDIQEDDFFDFDDFDDEEVDSLENQKIVMEAFNESHKCLPAAKFLEDYDYLAEEIPLDLEEIDMLLFERFTIGEDNLDLNIYIDDIREFFTLMSRFIHQFSEFDELDNAIVSLSVMLDELDLKVFTDKKIEFLGRFINAIIIDIYEWKENIFVMQNAVDVFYANASLLNSYIHIKNIIKNNNPAS